MEKRPSVVAYIAASGNPLPLLLSWLADAFALATTPRLGVDTPPSFEGPQEVVMRYVEGGKADEEKGRRGELTVGTIVSLIHQLQPWMVT